MDDRRLEDVSDLIRAAAERLDSDAPFRLKVLVQMLLVELHGLRVSGTVSTESSESDRA